MQPFFFFYLCSAYTDVLATLHIVFFSTACHTDKHKPFMLVLHSLHYMFLSHACTICSCLIASIDHYILMSHASLQCLIAACTKFTCLCGPSPTPDLIGQQ